MSSPIEIRATANSTTVGAVSNTPDNQNFLSPLGFRFGVRKMPNVNWFVQSVNLPGITLGDAVLPSAVMDTSVPGEKLTFDPLEISFKVDEDLQNWMEIQEWLRGIAPPDIRANRGRFVSNVGREAIYSDATLIILNSNMNANFEVQFHELFPTSLGGLDFNTTDGDVTYITSTVTFRYTYYDFREIN